MAKLTAAEFQEKHARRLKGAVADMQKGVEMVTESPTAKAAKKADKMLANLTTSVQNGKWAAGLQRVTVDEWKKKMIEKGIPRVATGIDGAKDKVIAFASQLLPHIDKVKSQVDKMPDVTLEDSIQRMTTFVRGMAGFKRT